LTSIFCLHSYINQVVSKAALHNYMYLSYLKKHNLCFTSVEDDCFTFTFMHMLSILCRYERLLAALGTASPQPGRVAQCLVELREDNKTYLHNLFKKKRVAADHALVVLVSDERRNQKPYAVPILLIPYHSIRDQFLQQFLDKCHEEAKKLGLIPVGKSLYFTCEA